jgi:hypothetical protein
LATSEAEIANQALSALGLDADIQALGDTDANSRACNLFYAQTRDGVLRDFPWPFANKVAVLTLVAGTPNEWGYQYRYPSDALAIWRILPYGVDTATMGRQEYPDTRIRYSVSRDATGRLIWTFMEDAWVEYTMKVTDVAMFPPDFTDALAYLLAIKVAPRLAGAVEGAKMAAALLPLYQWSIARAKANAANEDAPDRPTDSEFITIR